MRLADLEPRWWASEERYGMGFSFICPCGCGHRLPIAIDPPLDEGRASHAVLCWKRSGDTFETLTLEPDVNVPGHWRGWIRDGEMVTA